MKRLLLVLTLLGLIGFSPVQARVEAGQVRAMLIDAGHEEKEAVEIAELVEQMSDRSGDAFLEESAEAIAATEDEAAKAEITRDMQHYMRGDYHLLSEDGMTRKEEAENRAVGSAFQDAMTVGVAGGLGFGAAKLAERAWEKRKMLKEDVDSKWRRYGKEVLAPRGARVSVRGREIPGTEYARPAAAYGAAALGAGALAGMRTKWGRRGLRGFGRGFRRARDWASLQWQRARGVMGRTVSVLRRNPELALAGAVAFAAAAGMGFVAIPRGVRWNKARSAANWLKSNKDETIKLVGDESVDGSVAKAMTEVVGDFNTLESLKEARDAVAAVDADVAAIIFASGDRFKEVDATQSKVPGTFVFNFTESYGDLPTDADEKKKAEELRAKGDTAKAELRAKIKSYEEKVKEVAKLQTKRNKNIASIRNAVKDWGTDKRVIAALKDLIGEPDIDGKFTAAAGGNEAVREAYNKLVTLEQAAEKASEAHAAMAA